MQGAREVEPKVPLLAAANESLRYSASDTRSANNLYFFLCKKNKNHKGYIL